MHSFIHSFTHSLIHSFTHSLIQSCIHSFIHSLTHSVMHSFIHSLTHSLIHSFTHSLIQSCIHSFIHCLPYDSPQPIPKPVLHTVRSTASSFNLQYPLDSLRSSSSCLRFSPRFPLTSNFPSIFLR